MNDPIYKIGLSDEEVNIRKQKNLVNFNNEPTTKSIKEILRDNIFTYFNIVNSILCALISITLGMLIYIALFELLCEVKENIRKKELQLGLISGVILVALSQLL